ncbi:MAG: SurA N-terminal domain-containing protein, partial [bacterium]
MLQAIRERTAGWLAAGIIMLLIIPFAFWGIQNYFQGGSDAYVAKVNKEEITYSDYRQALADYQARMRQFMGDRYDASYFEQPQVKRQVLDGVIQKIVLKQYLTSQGYAASAEQVRDAILGVDAFAQDGKFDPELYRALLAQRRMTPEMFQSRVAEDLVVQQLPNVITAGGMISDPELDLILKAQKQQRSFDYLILAASDFSDSVTIEDEAVQSFYDTHQDDYMIPERVKIDYIEVNAADLESKVEVDEALLKERYEGRSDFIEPERRKAAHILVAVDETADADTVAKAKQKAESILTELKEGKDFAEVAKAESDDPGSKDKGGDLGWIDPGVMVPSFEKAVNALNKVGELSGLVKTKFGFHIIKLTDYSAEHRKTFEETREELEKDYRAEKADEQYLKLANDLGSLTYENIDSLEPAAKALGLEIKHLDYFSRSYGPGIA